MARQTKAEKEAAELEEQTAQDEQALEEALNENPHGDLAPLYGDYENTDELDQFEMIHGEEVIRTGTGEQTVVHEGNTGDVDEDRGRVASKIDGTELVEQAHTIFNPVLGRAEVPPVEYGFDMAENDNVDPIETDGIQDQKDRNRRAVGVIDPNLNDSRREKYPDRSLTARSRRS